MGRKPQREKPKWKREEKYWYYTTERRQVEAFLLKCVTAIFKPSQIHTHTHTRKTIERGRPTTQQVKINSFHSSSIYVRGGGSGTAPYFNEKSAGTFLWVKKISLSEPFNHQKVRSLTRLNSQQWTPIKPPPLLPIFLSPTTE